MYVHHKTMSESGRLFTMPRWNHLSRCLTMHLNTHIAAMFIYNDSATYEYFNVLHQI